MSLDEESQKYRDRDREMQACGYAMAYADAEMHARTGSSNGAAHSQFRSFAEYAMTTGRNKSLQDAYQDWKATQ